MGVQPKQDCGQTGINRGVVKSGGELNMENWESLSEEEKTFEKNIKKEIDKLDYYLGDTEELIESGDFKEMVVVCKRTDEILDRLNDLVSQMQELKLEHDVYTPRDV